MVPDLDLQLQVVMKALTDTVMPALDPAQRVAAEQLGLSLATLGMIRSRLPLAASCEWQALANAIDLAGAVHGRHASEALAEAIHAASALLGEANPAPAARAAATRHLLSLVSGIARDPATPADVLGVIVERSKPALDLARAWCLPGGFEPDARDIPGLEKLLAV